MCVCVYVWVFYYYFFLFSHYHQLCNTKKSDVSSRWDVFFFIFLPSTKARNDRSVRTSPPHLAMHLKRNFFFFFKKTFLKSKICLVYIYTHTHDIRLAESIMVWVSYVWTSNAFILSMSCMKLANSFVSLQVNTRHYKGVRKR